MKKWKAARQYGKDVEFLSGADAMYALPSLDTEENKMVINSYIVLEGNMNIKNLQDLIQDRLLNPKNKDGEYKYKKLRQELTEYEGYFAWRMEKDFKVEDHVALLEENGEPIEYRDDEELAKLIEKESYKPFPKGKSPWKFTLASRSMAGVPLYKRDESFRNECILICRIHHTLGDGVSFVRMILTSLVDKDLNTPKFNIPKYTKWNVISAYIWSIAMFSVGMMNLYCHFESNILHGPKLTGKKHFVWSKPIKIDLIKKIRVIRNVKFNDVVMSCISGALQRYYRRHGDHRCKDIHCVIPVALHSLTDEPKLENKFSVVPVNLSMSDMPPTARLEHVKRKFETFKRSPDILFNYTAVRTFCDTAPEWLCALLFNTTFLATLVASNVPGPVETIAIQGHKIIRPAFFVPQRGRTGMYTQ